MRRGGVVWRLQEAGRAGMRMWGSAWGGGRGGILGVPVGRRAWSPIMGSPQPGSPDPIHCDPTPPCPTASPPTAQSMESPYPTSQCHHHQCPPCVPIPHVPLPPLLEPHYGVPIPHVSFPHPWHPRIPHLTATPPRAQSVGSPYPTSQCHHHLCPLSVPTPHCHPSWSPICGVPAPRVPCPHPL